ncbi:related to triacylglycerol lipase II precursor [Cephalotrichum gorgonifer]|uniref:Carboxylic ester hydrolase n=1 Tax=Cephalotrichum gorgonifer TaxID=2041049 RepID=A0AAE8N383_9PEZI|nr:related to triacylglycerol lipase II precursor [Cephalotrichum gorgonifer]
MLSLLQVLGLALPLLNGVAARGRASDPTATIKNGTYAGKYVRSLKQDVFLGIPFAQPPVGELRFRNPQPLNESFTETRDAKEYGDSCVGYGNSEDWPHTMSEDCLTLNIVRPTGYSEGDKLPVAVFIHGGGYSMDYSANGVYNLSFIVQESTRMHKPIIAASMDYRLSGWGFLGSQEAVDAGVANLGLKDQRLSLYWIAENIAAFGGDPSKVTIFGESAGGHSVASQALAYGGVDDGLFRAMIIQSAGGGPRGPDLTTYTARYNRLAADVGCDGDDKLDCLRRVPFDALNAAIANSTSGFGPVYDGDFIRGSNGKQLREGNYVKVPLLIGTNADEGTLFAGSPMNSDEEIALYLAGLGYDDDEINVLIHLYPNIDAIGLPREFRNPPNSTRGSMYKRFISLFTDHAFHAFRRYATEAWSDAGLPVYSYLFDSTLPARPEMGAAHWFEIPYVFNNILGLGMQAISPFATGDKDRIALARLMTRMWVSFVHDLDPNNHGVPSVDSWPLYNATGGYGDNFYFHPTEVGTQPDTLRLAGTTFINSVLMK